MHQMYTPPPMYQPLNQSIKPSINQPESFGGLAPPSYRQSRFDQSINQSNPYRDVFWAIALIVDVCAIIGFGVYYILTDPSINQSFDQSIDQSINVFTWPVLSVLGLSIILSMIVSLMYLQLMHQYAGQLINLSTYMSIGLMGLGFVSALIGGSLIGALMCGLMCVMQIYWYQSIKQRIPFSALLCEISGTIMNSFRVINQPTTLLVSLIGMVVQMIWFAIWVICAAAIYRHLSINQSIDHTGHHTNNQPPINLLMVGLLISLYWTSMTINYIVQSTVAGVAGVWYFILGNPSIDQSINLSNPTYHSFKRSVTTSLGSLSLAAFILSLIKTLRAILQAASNQRTDENRSLLIDVLIGCAGCLLSLIDGIISYINQYSITRIALYGESFTVASDRALTFLKHRGLDAVVNDSLIGTACTIGALIVGLTNALIITLISWIYMPSSAPLTLIATISFFIGFALSSTAFETLEATVMALFVSLAEDPNVLYLTKPDIYERLVTAITVRYPYCRLDSDAESQRYGHGGHKYGAFAM